MTDKSLSLEPNSTRNCVCLGTC